MMILITKNDYDSALFFVKRSSFRLQVEVDLCIILLRPAPRWAKWSRGVRTRGLRVGLVGGPRPLLFLGKGFHFISRRSHHNSAPIAIDFREKCLNIRHGLTL